MKQGKHQFIYETGEVQQRARSYLGGRLVSQTLPDKQSYNITDLNILHLFTYSDW